MVGESSCLNGVPHESSAVAIVDTQVWRIPADDLIAAMQQNWWLTRRVISLICRKKDVFFQQILDLSFNQAIQRIARLLLNLCHQYGRPHPKGMLIAVHSTHQDIAGMVNASRVTVGNVLNMMMDQGLLVREGKHFILTDLEAMKSLSGE